MNLAGGIITKGLGLDACKGMIVNQFGLTHALKIEVRSYGGGPYPGPAWNKVQDIKNFYKEVEYTKYQEVPDYQHPKEYVKIVVTLNDKVFEREYLLNTKEADRVVKVVDILNATKQRITASVSNFKRVIHNAIVKIRNIRQIK